MKIKQYFKHLLKFKPINYRYTGNFLSLRTAIWLVTGAIILGVIGYVSIEEDYTFWDGFYMVMITFSTVGYGEVKPLSEAGQIFTSFLIILNIGVFAYSLSAFTYYVIQGEIFKSMHLNQINTKIDKLSHHVILCGFGKHGSEIAEQLIAHDTPFVIIDRDEEKIPDIQSNEKELLYIHDDATNDEALEKAGIEKAIAIIAAMPDDSENVFTVLSARQLNPKIKIISRAFDKRSSKKLKLAGANHVIMPEQIGGFYMAALVSKPTAAEFFSFLSDEYQSDIVFEEINYKDVKPQFRSKSIRDMDIRKKTGANVIGLKQKNGGFKVNPSPDTAFEKDTSLIILGNHEHIDRAKTYFYK